MHPGLEYVWCSTYVMLYMCDALSDEGGRDDGRFALSTAFNTNQPQDYWVPRGPRPWSRRYGHHPEALPEHPTIPQCQILPEEQNPGMDFFSIQH